MHPGPSTHLRLARPTRELTAAERFWTQGLGLHVLWRSDPADDDHQLLALGWPTAPWHLELVHDPAVVPAPTQEDLLVLYLDGGDPAATVAQLERVGGVRVPSRNPYWDQHGTTVQDPDGYRLVLSRRSWSPD